MNNTKCTRDRSYYDDLDYLCERGYDEDIENDFVTSQRRYKERAAAAFAEDLADFRRQRRDMQDRIFDVIDLNAEIEKAKTTLEAADFAFQRHASKFDNTESSESTPERKIYNQEFIPQKKRFPKTMKWIKVPSVEMETFLPYPLKTKQEKYNTIAGEDGIEDPLNKLALLPLKRRILKRKKSVSF
ncbi:uncharacterized protein LOC116434892 isoform X2 [Nomia melanderi]|uniref:uncharacterized protein LOC116434892 isoform X2 n=1 Tax=Nomia melanderi TaxID=2448451 RepID=UPI0013046882|nr:uncharacterized protein LOC116434892 isoform X2 [Nomia melanderi]